MLKFGFGGKLKPRKFEFNPRYYDEAKENLESRLDKYSDNLSAEDQVKERIKFGIRQKFNGDTTFRAREHRKSNLRLVYIMIILFFVTYMILKSDKITKLMEYLGA